MLPQQLHPTLAHEQPKFLLSLIVRKKMSTLTGDSWDLNFYMGFGDFAVRKIVGTFWELWEKEVKKRCE